MTSNATLMDDFFKSQKKKCEVGEHYWSNWTSNHSTSGGLSHHWFGDQISHKLKGLPDVEFSIYTKECLCCPARKRQVAMLGNLIDLGSGMSRHEILHRVSLDV